jgi:glutamate racemase
VACNTVSAVAIEPLRQALASTMPVIGVIEPGARAAAAASQGGSVVVLGTAGTVRSGAYGRALAAEGVAGARVHARACPLLVPLVEEGWTAGEVPRLAVARYLEDLPADTDVVVMGCTHYPLLRLVLRAALDARQQQSGRAIALVDGAEATAAEVASVLASRALARSAALPTHRLLVTDAPDQLARVGPAFLGEPVDAAAVELVDVLITT